MRIKTDLKTLLLSVEDIPKGEDKSNQKVYLSLLVDSVKACRHCWTHTQAWEITAPLDVLFTNPTVTNMHASRTVMAQYMFSRSSRFRRVRSSQGHASPT